ncbi:MAG: hypothetical protein CMN57_10055 [Gammaproteobacteria bacterium]|nr:hypothetical protein [Gammaproteobacteria bacterium]
MTSASKSTSRRKPPASPAKTAGSPAKRTTASGSGKKAAGTRITPERRHEMIAEAAYLRAESRGFAPADPVHDWLMAEQEVDARLTGQAQGADTAVH